MRHFRAPTPATQQNDSGEDVDLNTADPASGTIELQRVTEQMKSLVAIVKQHSLAYNYPSLFDAQAVGPDIELAHSQALRLLNEAPSHDRTQIWNGFKNWITCRVRELDKHTFLASWRCSMTTQLGQEPGNIEDARTAVIRVPTLVQFSEAGATGKKRACPTEMLFGMQLEMQFARKSRD